MPETITDIDMVDTNTNPKLTETMFPQFKQVFPMLATKLFKDICVPDVPVSKQRTRQTANATTLDKTAEFLIARLADYKLYLTDLLNNVTLRFNTETFNICTSIGKILNFDALYSAKNDELTMLMNPRNILQFQDDDSEVTVNQQQLFDIINNLSFVNQHDTAYLQCICLVQSFT